MTTEEENLFSKIVKMKRENELLTVIFEELDEFKKNGGSCYACEEKLSGLFFAYEEYRKWKTAPSNGQEQECLNVIPGTFIMCGEGYGEERQYCSDKCYKEARGEQ